MGQFPVTFDPSATKVRLGLHPCQGAEPAAADLVYFPATSAAPTSATITGIEDPSFQVGQKALPVAGPVEIAGDLTFSTAPDATLPLEAAGLVKASAVEDLGGGAYRVLLGPSQATDVGLAFLEIDNSDPSPQAFYNVIPATLTWAVEPSGLFTVTVAPLATIASRWGLAVEWYPTPATGRLLQVRGVPPQNFERDTGVLATTAVDLYFRLIDNSTSIPWFVAMTGRPGPITGTVEMTGTATLTGTGTLFLTELYRGDLLDVDGNLLTVVGVISNTVATLSGSATVAAGTKAVREFGTAQSVGQISMGFPLRVGLDGDFLEQYGIVNDSVTGAKLGRAAETGHSVEAWLFSDAGIPTPVAGALTGSQFDVAAGSKTITGTGSSFVTELYVGALFTTAAGQVRRIASITSATVATADRNFATTEAAATATVTPIPTYALTGTWTFAATNTITAAADGAALTEVTPGQWIHSPAGQVARVVSVTDDDTIVLHKVMVIEASVAISSDFTFRVPRLRSTWSPTALASGPQPSTQCQVLFEIDALDAEGNALIETQQRLAQSFSLPYQTGATVTGALGTSWGVKTGKTTVSQGQATIVIEKTGKSIAELIEAKARVRVKLSVTTGKQISTSAYEYSKVLVIHGAFAGTPLQAPSADERNETILIDIAVPATADTDYPDSINLEIFTDRATPLATTALS